MSKFKWQTNTEHDFVKITQKLKKCLDTGKFENWQKWPTLL